MCGIAGALDLTARPVDRAPSLAPLAHRMADAIVHRGPDEDGYLDQPGLSLANRRLSIVGLADGRQPITNEDGQIAVVFNGELFDYPEWRERLEAKGHVFRTHTDTELLPHLYEEYGEDMLEHVRGQFAFALWDARQRHMLLARDRFGICPLFWTVQKHAEGDVLLFASEIKALFASGAVPRRADPRGINEIFTFFASPGPATCFAGVQQLRPGFFLSVRVNAPCSPDTLTPRPYWHIDFPDAGQEDRETDEKRLTDRFEALLLASIGRRLRADVPVVSYLSGGVDSSVVVALAGKVLGRPIPTFTVGIGAARFNEETEAAVVARHVGAKPVVVKVGDQDIVDAYPELIRAAEMPVADTACAALLLLAREVHRQGFKVALTGEGSDEWLGGYPWFRIQRLLRAVPWLSRVRPIGLRIAGLPTVPRAQIAAVEQSLGGPNAWLNIYGVMSLTRLRFYSPAFREQTESYRPFAELGFDPTRLTRWHPLSRSLAVGGRVMLAGMLLSAKGDRVAMNSSVEVRYPFLDEDLYAFLAHLHPRWKLHRFTEKYLLRRVAERWLPKSIAWRRKAMFRAPMDCFHAKPGVRADWVEPLLSPASLQAAGYFDPIAVQSARHELRQLSAWHPRRAWLELGLSAVTATMLWHQTYLSDSSAV